MQTAIEIDVNKNMLSGMEPLLSLSGDEFVEVVRRLPDGSYKNYRTLVTKLRTGKSVFDLAVENGFAGTQDEFLVTLIGESAYQAAVRLGEFTGTQEEWVQSMEALFVNDIANAGFVLTADERGVAMWAKPTAASVGLDQVDNTSDEDKPLSKAARLEFQSYLQRSRVTTEVMKSLLSITGVRQTEDKQDIIFDEGRVTPV